MRRHLLVGLAVAAAVAAAARSTEAATITFDNAIFTTGAGIGTVPVILIIQEDPSEEGSVSWDGSADVITGDTKPQSQTCSVSSLASLGITGTDSRFGLVLNISEPAPATTCSCSAPAWSHWRLEGGFARVDRSVARLGVQI